MVVVSGTLVMPPGSRDAVLVAMGKCVAETVKEEGCITYRFYSDPEDENVYRVFEEWSSPETLGAHGKSAHLAEYRESLASLGLVSRDVKMYRVDEVVQL